MPVAFLEEAHGPSSKSKVLASFQRKNHKLQAPDGSKSTYINPDDYLPTENVSKAGLFRCDARMTEGCRSLCSQQVAEVYALNIAEVYALKHGLLVDTKHQEDTLVFEKGVERGPLFKPVQVCPHHLT